MEQFIKFEAIFRPKEMNTLRPELIPCVGKKFTFYRAWMMDESDMFPGVWACLSSDHMMKYWVPEFDLEILNT